MTTSSLIVNVVSWSESEPQKIIFVLGSSRRFDHYFFREVKCHWKLCRCQVQGRETIVGNISGVRCTAHAWRGPAGARRAGAAPTAAWTSVPPPARDMDSKLWIPPFSSLKWITKYKALGPNEALLDYTACQYPRCTNGSNVAW